MVNQYQTRIISMQRIYEMSFNVEYLEIAIIIVKVNNYLLNQACMFLIF